MFNTTFDLAQNADGRTAVNRISYVLDEFGNLPAIPNMGTNLSIGLSTNQEFYLFVQNNEQIIKIYGAEEAETIFGNCTVNMYIKSVSDKTMEKFEKASGDKTVTVRHKNENEHGGVSISSNTDKQAVLSQGQLRKLQAGEAFISIGVKAETKAGQKRQTILFWLLEDLNFPIDICFSLMNSIKVKLWPTFQLRVSIVT